MKSKLLFLGENILSSFTLATRQKCVFIAVSEAQEEIWEAEVFTSSEISNRQELSQDTQSGWGTQPLFPTASPELLSVYQQREWEVVFSEG